MKRIALIAVAILGSGVYRFATKAGEDYPSASGIATTGEDNALTLIVHVF